MYFYLVNSCTQWTFYFNCLRGGDGTPELRSDPVPALPGPAGHAGEEAGGEGAQAGGVQFPGKDESSPPPVLKKKEGSKFLVVVLGICFIDH